MVRVPQRFRSLAGPCPGARGRGLYLPGRSCRAGRDHETRKEDCRAEFYSGLLRPRGADSDFPAPRGLTRLEMAGEEADRAVELSRAAGSCGVEVDFAEYPD